MFVLKRTFLHHKLEPKEKTLTQFRNMKLNRTSLETLYPPGAWIFVCCECRVLSGRDLCDELITRPEESYRLCCVVVFDLETSRMGAPYIYDISHLRVKVFGALHGVEALSTPTKTESHPNDQNTETYLVSETFDFRVIASK